MTTANQKTTSPCTRRVPPTGGSTVFGFPGPCFAIHNRAVEGGRIMVGADTLKRPSVLDRSAAHPEEQRQTFEIVALPHLNDLFRTATRLLGRPTEAEDIVQETYLSAWKSFSRFESGTDCRAWLFTIMSNAIRQYRRKWFDRKVSRGIVMKF
jgi:Sigma-70 region 2